MTNWLALTNNAGQNISSIYCIYEKKSLIKRTCCFGSIKIINGKPLHPQSQRDNTFLGYVYNDFKKTNLEKVLKNMSALLAQ